MVSGVLCYHSWISLEASNSRAIQSLKDIGHLKKNDLIARVYRSCLGGVSCCTHYRKLYNILVIPADGASSPRVAEVVSHTIMCHLAT